MSNKIKYNNFITEDIENRIMETISNIFDCTVSIANNPELNISKKINRSCLCEYIENNKQCNEICINTTKKLAEKVLETGEMVTGYCPFGFIKTIIPIKVLNEIIGAIFCCGKFYEKKPTAKQVETIAKKFGFDVEIYNKYLKDISVIDEKRLTISRNEIYKNISELSNIVYNNYILKELAKREMFLKDITRIILNTTDKDEVISEIVERLAREFDIQRVGIIDMLEDKSFIRDDYINGRNILVENLTKKDYSDCYKKLRENARKNGGIYVFNKEIVDSSNLPANVKKYWSTSNIKTVTTILVETPDIERLIIFSSYGEEKNWSVDELAFLSAVSEQIAMALRLSDLYETSTKTQSEIKEEE